RPGRSRGHRAARDRHPMKLRVVVLEVDDVGAIDGNLPGVRGSGDCGRHDLDVGVFGNLVELAVAREVERSRVHVLDSSVARNLDVSMRTSRRISCSYTLTQNT